MTRRKDLENSSLRKRKRRTVMPDIINATL